MLDPKLYTFVALAECQSTTQCAEKLHITQPAVSQHVKALEAHYNVELVTHKGRRLALTPAGRRFYKLARRLVTMDGQLTELMAQPEPRRLRFGATLSISEGVMPRLLPALMEHFPNAQVQFSTHNTRALLEGLDHGALDFALIEGNFDRAHYAFRPFMQARFVGLAKPGGPHSGFSRLEDCLAAPLLLRERGSGSRDIFESECRARSLRVQDFAALHEIESIPVILELAAQGRGITFAYECAARAYLETERLVTLPLADLSLTRPFYFVTLPGSLMSGSTAEIFHSLEQLLALAPV